MDHTLSQSTDEAIAQAVQNGDIDIFGVLVERYEQKLLRYGRRFLARTEDIEDIVQEIFFKVYRNLKSFDPAERFSPWIYRIAHNAFVNALRLKERSYILVDFDTMLAHPTYQDPDESEREQVEIKKLIDQGLAYLSPKYREILTLHYLEEMAYKDIAEVLQVPIGTVGIRLKRAKIALKKYLAKNTATLPNF